jgi:hypothetical protein
MKTRIQWKDAEWVAVARELYRIRPVEEYLRSTTMIGLQAEDFYAAQRVLPENRRRSKKAVQSMGVVRPGLIKAMAVIRAEVDAAILRKKAEEEAAALEAQAAAAVMKEVLPVVNAYEAAFAPLIDMIATEVTKRVQQMLVTTLPQVAAYKVEPKLQTNKRLKFGVIGPLSVQAQDIKKAFPDIDFIIIESGKGASSPGHVMGCDKIIGMTDFMDHSVDGVLKDRFKERYHRCAGGTSKIKHLIGILSNALKHEQATAA